MISPLLESVNQNFNNIYKNYRLKVMRYFSATAACSVYLKYKPTESIKDYRQIEHDLKKILPEGINYSFYYERIDGNEDEVIAFARKYAGQKLNYEAEEKDITIEDGVLSLFLPETAAIFASDIEFCKGLSEELDNEFCLTASINLIASKPDTEDEILSAPKVVSIAEADRTSDRLRSIKVHNLERLYGEIITTPAMYISDAAPTESQVVMCGRISSLEVKTGTRKSDPEKDFTLFKFVLSDFTGQIQCTAFATKSNKTKLERLENGNSIIAVGKLEPHFKDKNILEFKPRQINYCELPKEFNEAVFKLPPPDGYTVIFPEKYAESVQMDMFGDSSDVPGILKNKTYIVFDTETTGVNVLNDAITEFAAVKLMDGRITETLHTLINPEKHITEETVKLNGITDDLVKDSPTFETVAGDIFRFMDGATIIGHNVTFDINFLNAKSKQTHYYFEHPYLDTMIIARQKVAAKNYKLSTLCAHFNLINESAHRALSDTIATAKLFLELCKIGQKV